MNSENDEPEDAAVMLAPLYPDLTLEERRQLAERLPPEELPIFAMMAKLKQELNALGKMLREIRAEREAIANHFKKPHPKSQS